MVFVNTGSVILHKVGDNELVLVELARDSVVDDWVVPLLVEPLLVALVVGIVWNSEHCSAAAGIIGFHCNKSATMSQCHRYDEFWLRYEENTQRKQMCYFWHTNVCYYHVSNFNTFSVCQSQTCAIFSTPICAT